MFLGGFFIRSEREKSLLLKVKMLVLLNILLNPQKTRISPVSKKSFL